MDFESSITNYMLALKIFCNMFKSSNEGANSQVVLFFTAERQALIKRLSSSASESTNKSFQIAYATLWLNYVVLIKKMAAAARAHIDTATLNEMAIEFEQCLNALAYDFMNWDGEALFRILVAFGTLVAKTDSRIDYELVQTVATSLQEIRLACKEISAKADKFPAKISSCAAYLLKDLN